MSDKFYNIENFHDNGISWTTKTVKIFGEIDHKISENDAIILNEAKSCIECKMVAKSSPGDHDIVFAEVVASHVLHPDSDVKVHIRKSGLDY